MSVKKDLELFASRCRWTHREGDPMPLWTGADLRGADLRNAELDGANLCNADLTSANLTGAYLCNADLTGANLTGALVTKGTVTTHAAGNDGGYRWHALRLQDGQVILQYGCERATLAVWRGRNATYGARHEHDENHWAIGPAVAIAAAEALAGRTENP